MCGVIKTTWRYLGLVAVMFSVASPAWAADGMILINQTNATNGNVTPGDAAGFPVTLSQPGSYRLSGNLTVPNANTTAISITTDDVTLDLNGFRIKGPVVCSGTPVSCNTNGTGVGVSAATRSNITVLNGTVRGVGNTALNLGPSSRVEKVDIRSNGGFGISVGSDSLINNNAVSFNGAPGINAGSSSTVSGNTVSKNASDGIDAGTGSVVAGNTLRSNAGTGIFVPSDGAIVTGNTVVSNAGHGINAQNSSVVNGNVAVSNAGDGINAQNSSVVSGNAAVSNARGGINTQNSSVVNGNAANSNGTIGIVTASGRGSTVIGNTANANANEGMVVSGTILQNTVLGNAGAPGFKVTDSGVGNNLVDGVFGINSMFIDCLWSLGAAETICPTP